MVATLADTPDYADASAIPRLQHERDDVRQTARIDRIIWSSRFRVHHRLVTHLVAGTFILCGDAEHVHSPGGRERTLEFAMRSLWWGHQSVHRLRL
ncbi:FAD-dependent monooxygenase [Agrobacterium larrymoorei]|uniref:FAD-dependent monooxygenase n=1 Tax=Agrobacterium larrymoorei TaxID=160699 RepID=UPI003CC916EC